jgi:hypothetical protein
MKGNGPEHHHLLKLLREIDYLAVVAIELDPDSYRRVQTKMQYVINHKDQFYYDYAQELDNQGMEWYCSEMIYALLQGYVEDPDFKARKILGRKVFAPDQVLKIGKVIYTNHPSLANIS